MVFGPQIITRGSTNLDSARTHRHFIRHEINREGCGTHICSPWEISAVLSRANLEQDAGRPATDSKKTLAVKATTWKATARRPNSSSGPSSRSYRTLSLIARLILTGCLLPHRDVLNQSVFCKSRYSESYLPHGRKYLAGGVPQKGASGTKAAAWRGSVPYLKFATKNTRLQLVHRGASLSFKGHRYLSLSGAGRRRQYGRV